MMRYLELMDRTLNGYIGDPEKNQRDMRQMAAALEGIERVRKRLGSAIEEEE